MMVFLMVCVNTHDDAYDDVQNCFFDGVFKMIMLLMTMCMS